MNLRAFYILFFIPILCAPSAQCAELATSESLSAQEQSLQKKIDDITMELAQLSQPHETVSLSDVTDRVKALQNDLKAAKSEMLNCLVAQGKMSAAKRFWLNNRTGIIITSAVVVTALIACGIWYYKTRTQSEQSKYRPSGGGTAPTSTPVRHGRLPVASVPPVVETPEVQAAVKIQSIYRGYLVRRRVHEIIRINEAIKGVSNPDLFSHDDPNPLSDLYKKKLSELRSSIASGASNQQLDRLRDEVNTYIKEVKYFCASCVIKNVYYKEFVAEGPSPLEETVNKFLWNKEIPEEDIQAMLNGTFLPLIEARKRLSAAIAQEEKVKAILNGTFPPLIKAREHSSAATIQRAYRRYNQSK